MINDWRTPFTPISIMYMIGDHLCVYVGLSTTLLICDCVIIFRSNWLCDSQQAD